MTPAHDPVIFNLTPFSVIIAEQPFQAMVCTRMQNQMLFENFIRTFRKGFRLKVTKEFDPNIYEQDVYCKFSPKKTHRQLEKFIIPLNARQESSYQGFEVAIRWRVYLSSFTVTKLFNMDDLDYSNADHIYVAVRQYLHDQSFPLKISENALDEIINFVNGPGTFGQISRENMLNSAAKIACDALGIQR